MKRSKLVPMVMLGTLLVGCSGGDDSERVTLDDAETVQVKQETYASMEDCLKDWNDSENCKQEEIGTIDDFTGQAYAAAPGTQSHGGYVYVGPHYYFNHSTGIPMAIHTDGSVHAVSNSFVGRAGAVSVARATSVGSVSIARGGFGGSAHAMSAGG
jgi:hypothetical protein